MTTSERKFDIALWQIEILDMLRAFQAIEALLNDPAAVEAHVLGIARDHEITDSLRRQAEDLTRAGLRHAKEVYARQMIVTAASVLELFMRDFFVCLFVAHPRRAHDFVGLSETNSLGLVPWRRVADAPDLPQLIAGIADECAGQAIKGDLPRIVARIEKLTDYTFDVDVVAKATEIRALRNGVVHEGRLFVLTAEEVQEVFGAVHRLLQEVGYAARVGCVPYEDKARLLEGHPA